MITVKIPNKPKNATEDAKGRTVVKKRFNFMGALNGDFYKIDFARTVRVKKDDIYTIKFKPWHFQWFLNFCTWSIYFNEVLLIYGKIWVFHISNLIRCYKCANNHKKNSYDANKLVFSIDGVGSRYAEGAVLSVDGEEKEGTLCLTLQGGDVDYFWVRITISNLIRCYKCAKQSQHYSNNTTDNILFLHWSPLFTSLIWFPVQMYHNREYI